MPCYHPLKAFYRNVPGSRKKDIVFVGSGSPLTTGSIYKNGHVYSNPIDIPCGQCLGCRLEYSRQWATRCVLESFESQHNYFVTLTYSPENESSIKKDCFRFDVDTGEVVSEFQSLSLVPEHLSKFIKDLRRYFEYHYNFTGIRFFACGEYGDKTMRPHYHMILFNCPIPDLKFECSNFQGDPFWSSEILSKIWGKGFVSISSCNFNTCSYVSRYMLKKQKGQGAKIYEDFGVVPPFTRSSRNPGIARNFYDAFSDKIYSYDSLVITDSKGKAKKVMPPKYFDRLYDIECPEDFDRVKLKRSESAENSMSQKLSQTSLDKDTYLSVCEDIVKNRTSKLLRSLS